MQTFFPLRSFRLRRLLFRQFPFVLPVLFHDIHLTDKRRSCSLKL